MGHQVTNVAWEAGPYRVIGGVTPLRDYVDWLAGARVEGVAEAVA
jgi:hypothetical protein